MRRFRPFHATTETRQNRHDARVILPPDEDVWKTQRIEMFDEDGSVDFERAVRPRAQKSMMRGRTPPGEGATHHNSHEVGESRRVGAQVVGRRR